MASVVKGGYIGKVLRVDLSTGKVTRQELPGENVLRQYIGCFGLGLRMLYDELPPGVRAIDPENPMIFLTGPLTGLDLPAATNLTLTTKNGSTDFTAGRSHTHGWFGIRLKQAGFDGLIVTGKAEKPVYLWIHDGQAEIRDAGKFWGKDTHETVDLVAGDVGQQSTEVAAIGPAGENLCHGAMIVTGKYHNLAHSGVGKVMGSKKLKAIAVTGSGAIPSNEPEKIKEIGKRWREKMLLGSVGSVHRQKIRKEEYRKLYNSLGFCGKNFQVNQMEEFGRGWSQLNFTARSCPRCPGACPYDLEITVGPFKGEVLTMATGGEAVEGVGAMLGITEPGSSYHLVDVLDRMGIEGSSGGCTLAMAIEAFTKGLITTKDTDGLELRWGDAQLAETLLKKYAHREGFGDVLAHGARKAAELIGGDAPKFAVHIKGGAMNLHDWRGSWGVLFSQIISGASGWPAGAADVLTPEPDAGYPERTPATSHKGKPLEVLKTQILKSMYDCVGVCWYGGWGVPGALGFTAEAISAATGWDCTPEELLQTGERVLQLERSFNVKQGLTPADDFDVSERLMEPPKEGPAKGISIKPHLAGMISEYYELAGWDMKTGKPWSATLNSLGLEDVSRDMWGEGCFAGRT